MPKRTNEDRSDLIALAMAQGIPIRQWAQEHKVHIRAAYRLAERPAVRAKTAEIRARMVDEAVGRLAEAATTAALTLWDLVGTERPDTVRLGAARALLSSLIEVQSHAEMSRRFAAIEKKLFGGKKK
jgi:hypothetical protein